MTLTFSRICVIHLHDNLSSSINIMEKEILPICEHCGAVKTVITGLCEECYRFPTSTRNHDFSESDKIRHHEANDHYYPEGRDRE